MHKYDGKTYFRVLAMGLTLLGAHMALAQQPATTAGSPTAALEDTRSAAISPADRTLPQYAADPASTAPVDPREVECVAKVIHHEAANQPEIGQVAVAQVIRSRMTDGRFASSACGVVRQQGQFFKVDAYHPPRDDARWALAMRVAARTLSGQDDEDVAKGALFFQSAKGRMTGRVQVAAIADHVFYR